MIGRTPAAIRAVRPLRSAVIALGGMVVWRSLRVGGYAMDDAIANCLRQQHRLLVGEEQAEHVKIAIGHSRPAAAGEATVSGRDLTNGQLRRLTVSAGETEAALRATVNRITE